MSEPMITARAALNGIALFFTKDIRSRAVAVELWRRIVTPIPDPHAIKRLRVPFKTYFRRDVPYARVKPFFTMRVPHNKRHTAPAI